MTEIIARAQAEIDKATEAAAANDTLLAQVHLAGAVKVLRDEGVWRFDPVVVVNPETLHLAIEAIKPFVPRVMLAYKFPDAVQVQVTTENVCAVVAALSTFAQWTYEQIFVALTARLIASSVEVTIDGVTNRAFFMSEEAGLHARTALDAFGKAHGVPVHVCEAARDNATFDEMEIMLVGRSLKSLLRTVSGLKTSRVSEQDNYDVMATAIPSEALPFL